MNREFRQTLLHKMAEKAGVLTSLVQQKLEPAAPVVSTPKSNFKELFLQTPAGPAREKLILEEALKRGAPKNLVPVTVDGPGGLKITYKVMPDYLMIDGLRITMAPATAQKVADAFGMKLPTDKMSQQIYQAADAKIRANPLSGAGYRDAQGVYHDGTDVVKNRINKSDAAVEYSRQNDQELEKLKTNGKTPTLVAGHGKDILQPMGEAGTPSMGGWAGVDGKPLQPYSSPHKGQAQVHSEYGLYTRLVGDQATVVFPDGRTVETSLEKLLNDPKTAKMLATKPGVAKYQV